MHVKKAKRETMHKAATRIQVCATVYVSLFVCLCECVWCVHIESLYNTCILRMIISEVFTYMYGYNSSFTKLIYRLVTEGID